MTSPKRHVRPELDREGPVRHFGGVFADRGQPPADPSSRGVELGYRVIEEYLRQGQAFARAVRPPSAGSPFPGGDPRKLTERMMQTASDLAAMWLDYAQGVAATAPTPRDPASTMGGFDVGGGPPESAPRAPNGSAAAAPAVADASRDETRLAPTVTIDVASSRRAEVTVELRSGSASADLVAHDLRAAATERPRLRGVRVEQDPAANHVTIRFDVPEDLPADTYVGMVVDATTSLQLGTITVCVRDRPAGADAR